jgi:hypothetical protein
MQTLEEAKVLVSLKWQMKVQQHQQSLLLMVPNLKAVQSMSPKRKAMVLVVAVSVVAAVAVVTVPAVAVAATVAAVIVVAVVAAATAAVEIVVVAVAAAADAVATAAVEIVVVAAATVGEDNSPLVSELGKICLLSRPLQNEEPSGALFF